MSFKTIIATIILEVVRRAGGWWLQIKNEKKSIEAQEALERVLMVSDALELMRLKTNAARVFLVRCENSGSKIEPGVTWYGTITDETTARGFEQAKPSFTKMELDDHYKRVVIRLGREGSLLVNRAETPPETLLGRVFAGDEVEAAAAYKIKYGPKKQFFLVAQFSDPGFADDQRILHSLEIGVGNIRKLMQ